MEINNANEYIDYLNALSLEDNDCLLTSAVRNDQSLNENQALWDSYPRIPQPTDLNIKLFPHQLVSVYNMEQLERTRKVKVTNTKMYLTDFGILADKPGSGKSLTVVASTEL